jgi:hypothetical protein
MHFRLLAELANDPLPDKRPIGSKLGQIGENASKSSLSNHNSLALAMQ